MAIVLFLAFLAAPFWESKAPGDWTDAEIGKLMSSSPWARPAEARGLLAAPGIQTYLSSALPMQEAEAEVKRRHGIGALSDEYLEFLKQHDGDSIVLTVGFAHPAQLDDAESKRMEEESFMKIGSKKIKMTGHFPPTPDDPYLRLVFPRAIGPKDKRIEFHLYLPGAPDPYRIAEYVIAELTYKGKLQL